MLSSQHDTFSGLSQANSSEPHRFLLNPFAHIQGGACYDEVHDLWQRVTKAEQAASAATAKLQTSKDAARHATLALKV